MIFLTKNNKTQNHNFLKEIRLITYKNMQK